MISEHYPPGARAFLNSLPEHVAKAANWAQVLKVSSSPSSGKRIPGEIGRTLIYRDTQVFRFGYDSPGHFWTVLDGFRREESDDLAKFLENPNYPPEFKLKRRIRSTLVSDGTPSIYNGASLAVDYFFLEKKPNFEDPIRVSELATAVWFKFRPIIQYTSQRPESST